MHPYTNYEVQKVSHSCILSETKGFAYAFKRVGCLSLFFISEKKTYCTVSSIARMVFVVTYRIQGINLLSLAVNV